MPMIIDVAGVFLRRMLAIAALLVVASAAAGGTDPRPFFL
jgi:hypothetical protein